jgi:hypothetical protein
MLEGIPYDLVVPKTPLKEDVQLDKSINKWALYLSEITLHPNATGFLNQYLGRAENVHYISISWDFGGLSPTIYPYLNFKSNKIPLEIMGADSYQFAGKGLDVFSSKEIVDCLNTSFFFFKNKKGKQSVEDLIDHVERLINESPLRKELSKMTFDANHKNVDRLVSQAALLNHDIQEFLSSMKKVKYLSTIHCTFNANENWKSFDEEVIEKGLVRITLNKIRR